MWPLDQLVDLLNQQRLTERDKDSIRQLVAQEITLNFHRLCRFFSTLAHGRQMSAALAANRGWDTDSFVTDLDRRVGSAPMWERSRWESAPILIARSLTSDELLRIGLWYTALDDVSGRYSQLIQRVTALRLREDRELSENFAIEDFDFVERSHTSTKVALRWQLDSLLWDMAQLIDNRRPFIQPAVEKALDATPPTNPPRKSAVVSLPIVDGRDVPISRRDGDAWLPVSAHDYLDDAVGGSPEMQALVARWQKFRSQESK